MVRNQFFQAMSIDVAHNFIEFLDLRQKAVQFRSIFNVHPSKKAYEDAVHYLDWHRHVNTAHLHGFKDDFPSYVVSAFLYLPRIRLLVRACLIVGHSMSWQSFDRGS